MQIGIVGLPFAGKTTIFSTLLKHKSTDAGFHKPEMERGVVKVPDERLDRLTAMFNPKKKVNAVIEYVKVQGVDSGGDKPLALSAQFLANLKNVDAIMVVVRDFDNDLAPHPLNRIDPNQDIRFINSEFLISDLSVVETRIERLEKGLAKIKDEQQARELALMKRFQQQLEQEKPHAQAVALCHQHRREQDCASRGNRKEPRLSLNAALRLDLVERGNRA